MSNRLQERRLGLSLTQPQISAHLKAVEPRADVGMVSRYEKGVCLPTGPQIEKLEEVLQAHRTELFDLEDLDLMGSFKAAADDVDEPDAVGPPGKPDTRFRKCYRIPRAFAEGMPDDLLEICGYVSWNAWHAAALKRLMAEYAARKRATKKMEVWKHEH